MNPLRAIAIACLLALAAAGCGGGSDDNGGSSNAETTKQDAAAKTNAAQLVTEVETCFLDQQTYTACKQPPGTKVPLGSGEGQAEVSTATDAGYTIVGHSASGTTFKVVRTAAGTLSRTCDKDGEGGCQTGGTW